jgi:predicted ATPase
LIRRVHITGYKSLLDLEVELQPLSVIFGPNAVGKSNFLDALQLLSRLVTARTLEEAFRRPYRGEPLESFSFGSGGVAEHLERESLTFTFEVDVELSPSTIQRVEQQIRDMRFGDAPEPSDRQWVRERFLRYRLTVEMLPRTGVLRVRDEYLAPLRNDGGVKSSRNAFVELKEGRLYLRMEGQAHPTYHELGLDHTLLSRPHYPPHYPHITAFREELAAWSFYYFEPREVMREGGSVREVRQIGPMGENLAAFLNTLQAQAPRQFLAFERALKTLIPRITGIDVGPNKQGEVELRLIEDGTKISARLVSEGTLRMLGLLAVASASERSTLVALEEPENGVHPRRIRLLAELLRSRGQERQFLVTTHSPLLPDLIDPDCLFVSQRKRGATTISAFQTRGPLFRPEEIDSSLEEEGGASPSLATVSERVLRGDFGD